MLSANYARVDSYRLYLTIKLILFLFFFLMKEIKKSGVHVSDSSTLATIDTVYSI